MTAWDYPENGFSVELWNKVVDYSQNKCDYKESIYQPIQVVQWVEFNRSFDHYDIKDNNDCEC